MFKKAIAAVVVVAVLALAVALWLVPTLAHQEKLINRTMELTMGEMFFQLKGQAPNAPITVKVGEVIRFVIKNEGKILHDFHVGKEPDTENRLYKNNLIPGFDMVEVDPSQTVKLTLQIPDKPGEWEIGCFQPGHYEAGQKAKFIVTK